MNELTVFSSTIKSHVVDSSQNEAPRDRTLDLAVLFQEKLQGLSIELNLDKAQILLQKSLHRC